MILGSSEQIYFVVPFLDTSALLSLFFLQIFKTLLYVFKSTPIY